MEGSGKMLVVAVGVSSRAGIIIALLGATQEAKGKKAKKKTAAKGTRYLFFGHPAVLCNNNNNYYYNNQQQWK